MRSLKNLLAFLAVATFFGGAVPAKALQKAPSPPVEPVAAQADDLTSIDGLMGALYDVISGPAGKKRNWDRMRGLFAPEARMGITGKRRDGEIVRRLFTVEEYITQNAKALLEIGFFEKELVRHIDSYGQMAQVFSSYESRHALTDEKPFARGINSLLLWNDGKRWWILNIFWQAESTDNPLPAAFANSGG